MVAVAIVYFVTTIIADKIATSIVLSHYDWSIYDHDISKKFESVMGFNWNVWLICQGILIFLSVLGISKLSAESIFGKTPSKKVFLLWTAIGVAECFMWGPIFDYFNVSLNEYLLNAYKTQQYAWLTPIAFLVGGAIGEEFLLRGLIYCGLAKTFLKEHGAIIIAAVVFTTFHTHFTGLELFSVFVGGVLYGYARYISGSIWVPVAMHGLFDIISYSYFAAEMAKIGS